MMTRTTTLLGAALLAAACGGETRDAPVSTTTARGTTASPSGAMSEETNTTQVRLVSALPATRAIDLATGDRVVFSAVPYKTVTPFREIEGNAERFTIRTAGASADGENVLADNREAMTDGSRYTIVALPDDGGQGAQLRVLKDDLAVDAGKAKLRVIHAAPKVGEVDIAMAGEKDVLFDDVEFGREAGFKEVEPGAGTLEMRRDDDDEAKGAANASLGRLQLEAGRAYTVVIAGANPRRPEFITFVDETMASSSGQYARPEETGGAGTTTGGPVGAGNTAGGAIERDPRDPNSGTNAEGRTSGERPTPGTLDTARPPTATDQRTGTMDRDRRGSTDEGTPPTTGTGSQGATTREPS